MPSPFPNLPPGRRGAVHVVRHDSVALRGNPWGDPHERDVYVWTPPGWDPDRERLPAILFLAAYAATGEKLLARGLSDVSMATRLDWLVDAGVPRVIGVLPDVMTRVGGSQFVDSPGLGDYATWLARELVPFIDARFTTTGRWAVAGHSSGGFGALHLAMTFPGVFAAVACHAGDMGFDLCTLGDLPAAVRGLQALGGPARFVPAFWEKLDPSPAEFAALATLCLACAYSPDPDARPIPARLPFDPDTGAVDFDVLAAWRRFDPVVRADDPAARDALAALRLLFVDAGDRDEYTLHLGARRFVARLRAHGVPVEHEEFRGGHRGTSWRWDVSLPKLAAAIAGAD